MFYTLKEYFASVLQGNNLFITIVVVLMLIIIQRITMRYLSKKKWASETIYLRVHTHVRNLFLVLITISIITIWIPQIQAFAFSVAAIAVALVVSLKEIITMFTGGLIRTSTDLFSIGDRIELNHIKGDVIRSGFFTTDLLEVGDCGQRTGRIIYIPNSFFFTSPIINEAAVKNFTFHVITLPVSVERYSSKIQKDLLFYIKELSLPYIQKAEVEFRKFARKNTMTNLRVEPRVLVKPYNHEQYHLIIRIPVPIDEKIKLEQMIVQRYTELISNSSTEK